MTARGGERQAPASGDILRLALTAPERLPPTAAAIVASDLDRPLNDRTVMVALAALAALLYARPRLVRPSLVSALVRVMARPISPHLRPRVAEAWQLLATSSLARPAARALIGLLRHRRRASPGASQALRAALPSFARWRPDTLSLDGVLPAALAPGADAAARDVMLREVIERLVFTSPRAFSRAMVARIIDTFACRPRLRYTLGFLVSRRGVPDAAKLHAQRWIRRRPALPTRSVIGEKPGSLLFIHNIDDGQGDEIIRIVPILQSLLDASPRVTATVLTRRPYLYDHPRVTTWFIRDDRAVDQALATSWDGIVDFNARTVPGVSTRPELDSRVTRYVAQRRLRLLIRGVTGLPHFTFETIRLGDLSLAAPLGLNRLDGENAYDATERLLIDLGLPSRAGLEEPPGGSVLVGTPSREAEAAWRKLRGRAHRPTALINGFGGAHPLKGFTLDKAVRLGGEIAGLVDEGYTAILLPSNEPWGRAEIIGAVLSHIGHRRSSHVRVGPDPATPRDGADLTSGERPEVNGSDRVMRLFKYFAGYADLVVTVEGWLMHIAYAMGRPFRLFMAPGSPVNWLPPGRGLRQRLVLTMSRMSLTEEEDLLREDDPPPLPSYARRLMLMAAMRGLAKVDGASAELLPRILSTPDPVLRASAVQALASGGLTPAVRARLYASLRDESALVRSAAALALLGHGVADEAQRAPTARAMLLAHVAVARQDWAVVGRLGAVALPALAATTREPDPAIRREAQCMAEHLIRRHAPTVLRKTSLLRTGREPAASTRARDARTAPA